jgi:hypothetical protein
VNRVCYLKTVSIAFEQDLVAASGVMDFEEDSAAAMKPIGWYWCVICDLVGGQIGLKKCWKKQNHRTLTYFIITS